MAKNAGPCFEFVISREGANVEFTFLPGNVSKQIFEETRSALLSTFQSGYGGEFIREISLENGVKVVAIDQTKVLSAMSLILGIRSFRDFKIKITGEDNRGAESTEIISTPLEVKRAGRVVPYFNKANNDIIARRRQ